MGYMFLPLRRDFDFSGRSRRLEYWMFMLLWVIVYSILIGMVIASMIEAADWDGVIREDGERWLFSTSGGLIPMILLGFFFLFFFIPMLSVQVRRFHDQDKSGAWVFVNFIPLGSIVVVVMMFIDGTPGPNRYGPDPKNRQPLQYGYGAPGGYPQQPGYGGQPAQPYPPQPAQPYPPQPQAGSGWPKQPGESHDPNARPLG